ncbi:MAG: cytochrome c3 family protein [Erythrobacter sp.]|uniref:cytochrome c3 family protein n=1 Tax=Erythrobacter sp. TaxID=1042 RepID=UPI001B04DB0D|nr:cytochrome c3 family protein [Erythrobacter sp.]MBO6766825.1 cytochrome c3 family protein [Erythrobacter sp.]
MTFLIRTVDHTATGREIVRDREVEGSRLTIGRATTNDVVIADLALEQHHVSAEVDERGRIALKAGSTRDFTFDGRKTTGVRFDPAKGGRLTLGLSTLAFSREPDGRTLVTVTQEEREFGNRDAVRRFDLASAMPSKRAAAWIGVLAILIAFMVVPIWTNLARTDKQPGADGLDQVAWDASWSTGRLSLAHHALENNCEACHVAPFVSVRDETCLACHQDIGDHAAQNRLAAARGPMSTGDALLWQVADVFGKEGPEACTTCHTEHEGAGRMEPAAQQFCSSCHESMDARLADTALGNAHDFGTDHPDLQALVHVELGSEDLTRVTLDGEAREDHGLRFPHAMHLSSTNGVARMAGNLPDYGEKLVCADCHRPTDDRNGFLPVAMESDCESCHSLVYDKVGATYRTLRHGDVAQMRADLIAMDRAPRSPVTRGLRRPGEFKRGGRYFQDFGRPTQNYIGIVRALSEGGVCGECHIPTGAGGEASVMPVFQRNHYFLNARFDHAPHAQEDCTSCHAADTSDNARDLLLPTIATCRECHKGAAAREADVPSTCAMCHSYHPPSFRPREEGPQSVAPARVAGLARSGMGSE